MRGGEAEVVRMELIPATPGTHRYTFEVQPLEGELTIENNRREALVEVVEGPLRVLYVEGEPRWEHGKLRDALGRGEKQVELVSLLRTGENKLYRQGVSGEGELAAGFPRTEEELFAYDGLMLGSVEASFFTRRAVARRRGLRRAARRRAARGRRALRLRRRRATRATPVADVLPLASATRARARRRDEPGRERAGLQGSAHRARRLAPGHASERGPAAQPEDLERAAAGLGAGGGARHQAGRDRAPRSAARRRASGRRSAAVPLLAQQRYGRGQALAFAASDTWRWRMRMDSKSNAHENFWRQMLRYLVQSSPRQFEVAAEQDVYAPGDAVRIVADLRDKKFNAVDGRARRRARRQALGRERRGAAPVHGARRRERLRRRVQGRTSWAATASS